MHISKFTVEVMQHLSVTRWKAVLEIFHEIETRREKEGRRRGISIGSVYAALDHLESWGLVDRQWRDDPPETLAARGGRRRTEWKLTEQGHRARATLPQRRSSVRGMLVPSRA